MARRHNANNNGGYLNNVAKLCACLVIAWPGYTQEDRREYVTIVKS